MNTENLVSKFLSHVLDQFFHTSLLKSSLVVRDGFETLECESENASLSILNPLLPIFVALKILLEFLLLL
jgi:hypothetical protein